MDFAPYKQGAYVHGHEVKDVLKSCKGFRRLKKLKETQLVHHFAVANLRTATPPQGGEKGRAIADIL